MCLDEPKQALAEFPFGALRAVEDKLGEFTPQVSALIEGGRGKGMLAETDVLRRTATLQAAYFLVTGLWPIVSRPTFEAVTGPKTDYWLVRTVGALASVIGTTLGVASYRNRVSSELAVLGIGSALAFGVVDVFYTTTGRISRVYLVDAAVECLIAGGWASALQRP